ncbi:MAG: hypothetical protein EBY30_01970 [Rhodospirillales bacterium]|nr:hypothetical protein [Rhodospirillales bacterium]
MLVLRTAIPDPGCGTGTKSRRLAARHAAQARRNRMGGFDLAQVALVTRDVGHCCAVWPGRPVALRA